MAVIDSLDEVEKQSSEIISIIEEIRILENEGKAKASELEALQKKYKQGEISGEVFKKLKEKIMKEKEKFELEKNEKWDSITKLGKNIASSLESIGKEFSTRAQESGIGTMDEKKEEAK